MVPLPDARIIDAGLLGPMVGIGDHRRESMGAPPSVVDVGFRGADPEIVRQPRACDLPALDDGEQLRAVVGADRADQPRPRLPLVPHASLGHRSRSFGTTTVRLTLASFAASLSAAA